MHNSENNASKTTKEIVRKFKFDRIKKIREL
jgi:hypothetical protein